MMANCPHVQTPSVPVSGVLSKCGIFAALALLSVVAAGCADRGAAKQERTVKASGSLTHKGQPLAYYQVTLQPEDGRRPAAGVTNEQGQFVLGTNREGDGAPPGLCKVSVIYVGPPNAGGDGMNNFTPPPPPKVKLASKYANPESSGLSITVPTAGGGDLKIEVP